MENTELPAKKKKSIKKVCWDEAKLAEQELEKKLNPKQKIDEPKTPYTKIEDDEDENYLRMLKEAQDHKLDEDVIKKAIESLENKFQDTDHFEDEEEKHAKFKEKQKKAYAGEFLYAKKKNQELQEETDEVLKETMENTVFNKYVGKLTKDSSEK